MKTPFAFVVAVVFSLNGFSALAQTTDVAKADAADAGKAKTAQGFATTEKAMQDASKSSAGTVTPTAGEPKTRLGGKAGMEEEVTLFQYKPPKPVDKNAKATSPIKSISKMTPEERAELRKEVVTNAKP